MIRQIRHLRHVPVVNVAATCVGTTALGPGRRSVVWVQGCPFRCAGCLAPDWIPRRPARLVAPAELASELVADPAVSGLTISGGEPMLQATALTEMVQAARAIRDLSVICFTGFTIEQLQSHQSTTGVDEFLDEIDVLIDGQYVASADDGLGLRGSANQRVHHLTSRLSACGYDFTGRARAVEIRVTDRDLLLVGVPPPGLTTALDAAVDRVRDTAAYAMRSIVSSAGGLP